MGRGTKSPDRELAVGTDMRLFRNTRLPAGGVRSPVNEPSVSQAGRDIMAVGNWYSAYSHTPAGTSWTYLDPFSIFGSGFCCDQVVTYDVTHNREFWLLQYNDHLTIANSPGGDLTSWCFYNLSPATVGLPASSSFDFNKIALSTNFLFIATNVYSSGGGFTNSTIMKLPIEAMAQCAGFGFSFLNRTNDFSPAFAQSAGDTMYWGTNWITNGNVGSTFRIGSWKDTDNSVAIVDRAIDPYSFMFIDQGNCASANGAVLNWCQRTDSRMSGTGYLAAAGAKGTNDAVLGWAFNALQDSGHPFPYIRRVYFRTSDMAYLGASEFYGTWAAHIYPSMAPDKRGHVGMAFAWGGGTDNSTWYPGAGVVLDDDVTPNQPWDYRFYLRGNGNPCLNSDGRRRWGDYLDIHPTHPAEVSFVASGFAMQSDAGSCGSNSPVEVANVVFGRNRDRLGWLRWR